MKKSYVFLSDGFEEIEALAVVDILRRAQIPTVTISMNEGVEVVSSHGVKMCADTLFSADIINDADYMILPGGSAKLNEYEALKELIMEHAANGGRLAAICAAPMVLGGLGLLDGRRATCYPGFEECLKGATLSTEPVVVDGSIVTANGPASSLKFAYTLVEHICGAEKANTIKQQMMFK